MNWKEVVKESDLVLEVCDVRFPRMSRIPEVENYVLRKGKKLLVVFNKSDLVEREYAECVVRKTEHPAVYVSARKRLGTGILRKRIKEMIGRGTVGVVGYPNTGKSSLINVLVGRHAAGTSPRPGFTRGIMKVKLSRNIYLIDTPGIIEREREDDLLFMGSFDPSKAKNVEKVGEKIAKILGKTLEDIAKEKNFLLKGGEPDIKRAAEYLIYLVARGKIDLRESCT